MSEDLQRLTDALRASEARMKAGIECLPLDFWMMGTDGTYVMQNSICRELWGDIVGKRPEDLGADPETLALWQDNNRRALAGETVRAEVAFAVKGRLRHFYNVVAPIYSEGELIGILGFNLDITDRKEAERELSGKNVALHEANERLASVIRSKDRMTAMISHELRNPLVTGLGYLEMLLEHKFGEIPPLAESKMLIAKRNLQRLSLLVELVLKYEKLLATADDDHWTGSPFDVRRVAEEVLEEFALHRAASAGREQGELRLHRGAPEGREQAQLRLHRGAPEGREQAQFAPMVASRAEAQLVDLGDARRELHLEVEPGLPLVIGDRLLIGMALTNLLNNAVAHAGPAAKVQVVCRRVSDREVQVSVEDSGVGIPSSMRESVFEPFVRGPTEHEGFGLGLPIVRAILAIHRADVTLDSREGKGTAVRFVLRAADPLD